jgi:hypothetical protein
LLVVVVVNIVQDLNYIMRIQWLAIVVKQQDVQPEEQLELVEMDVIILEPLVVVD